MNIEDIKSLSEKTREDGLRLFQVCEYTYKIAIFLIIIFGVIGYSAVIIMILQSEALMSIGVGLATTIFCFINYLISVFATHVGKVMVHTSFASVAILEHLSNK